VVSVTDPYGHIFGFLERELSTIRRKIMFLDIRARPGRRADSITAICEPIV
jgi:hypothetical protein